MKENLRNYFAPHCLTNGGDRKAGSPRDGGIRRLALLATLVAALPLTVTTVLAEANYVYHERTGSDVTGGAANTCGGPQAYVTTLNPTSAQSYPLRFKVEFQFYTDTLKVYYTTDGSTPSGAFGVGSGTTAVVAGSFQCTFTSGANQVDVGSATIPAQPAGTVVKYIVSAWHSGGGLEIFGNGPGTPCACGTPNSTAALATVFQYTVGSTTDLYWDINGSVAGAGGATPVGAWDSTTTNWSTVFDGTATTAAWTANRTAVFAAGTDASGSYTVVLTNASQSASGLTFQEGAVTLTNAASLALTLTGSGTMTASNGVTATNGLNLSGTIGYGKSGPGRVVLANLANTITGPVLVDGGILELVTSGRIGGTGVGAGNITINGGTLRNDDTGAGNAFLTANRSLIVGASGASLSVPVSSQILVYSGNISGSGNTLTVNGAGEFRATTNLTILTGGHNTFSKLVVDGAMYTLGTATTGGSDDTLGALPGGPTGDAVTLKNGGRLRGNVASLTLSANRGITLGTGGGTIRNVTGTLSIPSIITGAGDLIIGTTDTGAVTLGGANNYSGKTTVTTGTLNISSDGNLGAVPGSFVANQITLNGGTLALTATAVDIATNRGITLTANSTLSISASQAPSIESVIAGGFLLTKSSSGNVNLNASNTFSGGLTITGGGIRFNNPQAAGTGTITVTPASIITLRQLNPPGPASVTITNPVVLNANGGNDIDLTAAAGNSLTLAGPISGVGYLTRGRATGTTGTINLSGNNSGWSGGMFLMSGALGLGHKNALGTATLIINAGSFGAPTLQATTALTGVNAVTNVINYNVTNATMQLVVSGASDLELSGPMTLSSTTGGPAMITNNNSGSTIISGIISGSGVAFQSAGSGTLTLKGANTYSGGTTVSSGKLLVSNTSGSGTGGGAVTVSGGTLGGTGTISGVVTVNSAGTLSPGASIGTLTLGSSPSLSGTNLMEIDRGGSPNADKLVISGAGITYGGVLRVANLGAAPQGGDSFDLFDASSFSGSFTATNLPALASNLNWWLGNLSTDGSILVNTAPTGPSPTFTRAKGTSLKIAVTNITDNISEPDGGDTATYQGLANGGVSSQGVTVTTSGGFYFYTPVNDNNDTFQYWITDTRGGVTTNTVSITVASQGGIAQSIAYDSGGVTAVFAGIPGVSYDVERSATSDFSSYTVLYTTNAPPAGIFTIIDSSPLNPSGFYRTKSN